MPHPFGGHPRFEEYLRWARKQGCKVESGVDYETATGITRIVTADGKRWAIEVGTRHSNYLAPTTIARLDRLLDLESPWFSTDGDGENDA